MGSGRLGGIGLRGRWGGEVRSMCVLQVSCGHIDGGPIFSIFLLSF